jgi:hypothetical protein
MGDQETAEQKAAREKAEAADAAAKAQASYKTVKIDGAQVRINERGKTELVKVSHGEFGGYDFNKDGKVDPNERFDCKQGQCVELTPRRAKMLLDTHGFMYVPEGQAILDEQRAKAKAASDKLEADRKRAAENAAL